MDRDERIRLFGFSQSAAERELDRVEAAHKVDLQRSEREHEEEDYYPQFDQALRNEASEMGRHYELFYCLETNESRQIN